MILINIVFVIFFSKIAKKNEISLVKVLVILTIISCVALLILFGVRLKLDSSYLEFGFEQIETSNLFKTSIENEILSKKEQYLLEYTKFYEIFKLKSSIMLGIHLLINIVFIAKVTKLIKIKRKQEKMRESDSVLFDEEENIKI